jgi:MHS family proline/betaine transporter-like MFS transporter
LSRDSIGQRWERGVTAASIDQPRQPGLSGGTRAIIAASAGNLLEWYDFSVYAFFAIYIARNFFPTSNPGVDLVKAFLVFGLGFVIRPLGAILIGIYGDRAGRKAALTVTILIMACGTALIALAPSYAVFGMGAPLLLLAGRILQGFSAGGEIGGATAFLVEHAPDGKKGLFAAWLQASMGMSNILGALVAFCVTTGLTQRQVTDWGWRIPFLIGLLIAPVGLYLRRTLEETPHFRLEAERRRHEPVVRLPLVSLFRDHSRSVLVGMGISILWAVAVYVLLIFMPVLVQKTFHFTASEAFGGSLVGNVVFVAGCFIFGSVADRIGHRRMLAIGSGLLLVLVLPLFLWLDVSRSTGTLILVQSAFGIMVSSYTAVAPTILSGLFPTHVRTTGVSLVYNSAITIFGGFAPAVLTWLTVNASGSVFAPAWYVAGAAVPAIIAIPFLRARVDEALAYTVPASLAAPIRET